MAAARWVVSVSCSYTDPAVYGPFSERRARQMAEALNRDIERRAPAYEDEYEWVHAAAWPIAKPTIPELLQEWRPAP